MKQIISDDAIKDIYEQPNKTPLEFARDVITAYDSKLAYKREIGLRLAKY